jgi:hypothetical protein
LNLYAIAAAVALAFAAGWASNGWRLGEQMQQERSEWAKTEKAHTDKERADADARALELWAADQHAQKEITEHETKLSELERCIANGRGCGLRVRITKPAACLSTGEASGVGAGAVETAELDESARPAYRALRTGIVRLESALRVCISGTDTQPHDAATRN